MSGQRVIRHGPVRQLKRATKPHKRPCRSAPATPTGVTVTFVKNENRAREFWNARVKWNAVTADVAGRPLTVESYQVQLRATNASGVPLETDGADWDFWRQRIDADEDRRAVFRGIPRPKTYYYQARVRVLNRVHGGRCWSAWTAWTTAIQPVSGALTGPPAPTGLVLTFDKVEAGRGRAWRAKARLNQSAQWTPTDGDPVDIENYIFQLAVSSESDGTPLLNTRRGVMVEHDPDETFARREFRQILGKRYYRVRAKARALGRSGAWTSWTAWASPGGVPDPPTGLTWSNPTPALLVAKWTEPADLTDVDRYRVRVFRKPGPVLVDDAMTTSTRFTYHIPSADRASVHFVRVTSVEDQGTLDVDEDVPVGWDTPETSTDVDSADVTPTATWTSAEAPPSDGTPPSSSPTPTVVGGPGWLAVKWTAVANADVTTYEVHLSTTTGFTPSGATLHGQIDGTLYFIRKTIAGADLTYGTTYFVKLIAKDRDGSAAAGAQGSAAMAKAGTIDIAANAITTNELAADSVTASKIDVATLSAISADLGTVTAGTYKTGASGTRWEISSSSFTELLGYLSGFTNPGGVQVLGGGVGTVQIRPPWNAGEGQPAIVIHAGVGSAQDIRLLTNDEGTLGIGAIDSVLLAGNQARGFCAVQAYNDNATARDFGTGVTYGGVSTLTNVPSSITFTLVGTDANISSLAAASTGLRGFRFTGSITGASGGRADRTYVTVGN